jgi:Tol biopolymer transport system component
MRKNGFILSLLAFAVLSCENVIGTAAPEPVGIAVSASELDLILDEVKPLAAWLIDAEGQTLEGTPEWSSSDPAIATIESKAGVVTAIDIGTATMTASFGALRATVIVSVRPPNPPATFAIHLAPAALIAGGSDSLAAQAYDAKGRITDRFPIAWASSDPSVATIDAYGILVGTGPGTTTVTATVTAPAGTISASVSVPVIALTTSLSFARWTVLEQNIYYSTDVLTFSAADQETRVMERAAPLASMASPTWSADGSTMTVEVISQFYYDASHFWEDYNSNVYLFSGAASGWRALTTNGLSKSPSLSPDGTRVAYLQQPTLFSNHDVWVLDVGTGQRTRVTTQGGYYGTPIWSPDGTRLVFMGWVTNDNYLLSNTEVFIVNADGSGLTNLTNNFVEDVNPSWSPDGLQIAFVSLRETSASNPHSAVYVMNTSGANPRRLITGRGYIGEIAWSPDGRQIAYSDGGSLYVMNADGSLPARLTRPPKSTRDRTPAWKR